MAAVSENSLHNLSMPSLLKWGTNKNNPRRLKTNSNAKKPPTAPDSDESHRLFSGDRRLNSSRSLKPPPRPIAACKKRVEVEEEEARVKEKPIIHLLTRREGERLGKESSKKRDRLNVKEKMSASESEDVIGIKEDEPGANACSFRLTSEIRPKSMRLRGLAPPESKEKKKARVRKITDFTLSLSQEQIEEDFLNITGVKPPKKQQRRPRAVQKKLNGIFPGMWLCTLTLDSYNIPDLPQSGKEFFYIQSSVFKWVIVYKD